VKVLTVTNEDVLSAYMQRAADFEDCLLATCAKSNKCSAIVTRNKKDFLAFDITLLSPEELLESI
jgi:predicted nucleic-acid-binding protein